MDHLVFPSFGEGTGNIADCPVPPMAFGTRKTKRERGERGREREREKL
jgi:hypothetical protein